MKYSAILFVLAVGVTSCADDETPARRGDSHRIVGDTQGGGDAAAGDPIGGGDTHAGDPFAGGDTAAGDPFAGGDPFPGGDPASGDPASAGDAEGGDSGLCHGYDFGGSVVNIVQVGSLPAMTGGTIPLGAFDVVEAQTTLSLTGATIRSTWVFETASTMQIIEQIVLSGTPPEPTPRTLTWLTEGTSLQRQQICGGSDSFDNQFTVRTEVEGTFLDIRQNTLLFTYQLRE